MINEIEAEATIVEEIIAEIMAGEDQGVDRQEDIEVVSAWMLKIKCMLPDLVGELLSTTLKRHLRFMAILRKLILRKVEVLDSSISRTGEMLKTQSRIWTGEVSHTKKSEL